MSRMFSCTLDTYKSDLYFDSHHNGISWRNIGAWLNGDMIGGIFEGNTPMGPPLTLSSIKFIHETVETWSSLLTRRIGTPTKNFETVDRFQFLHERLMYFNSMVLVPSLFDYLLLLFNDANDWWSRLTLAPNPPIDHSNRDISWDNNLFVTNSLRSNNFSLSSEFASLNLPDAIG